MIDIDTPKVTISEEQLIKEAMDKPIGSERVENLVKKDDKVVIVVNDHTRPGPTKLIVQEVINRLTSAGL